MPPTPDAGPDEQVIKDRLQRTWYAFYGRFPHLRPIQRLATGPLLAGRPVLVSAPTATGKTEALLAPLVERLLAARSDALRAGGPPRARHDASTLGGPRLLVVSPTRALCNDLRRRLDGPLRALGVSLGLKTGDDPNPRGLDRGEGPAVLVTTPESLDSLLARRPATLRDVGAVVLDELHLLAGTSRGDQLRVLLARLDRVAAAPVQRAGASATPAHPQEVADDYLGAGARVVRDPTAPRPIDAELAFAYQLPHAVDTIAAWVRGRPGSKVLVFTNSRNEAEQLGGALGARLPTGAVPVWTHHGSLARPERLRVERAFIAAPSGVCVATMTLELGIDIGDVDGVVLVAPPPNVRSLVQRVGRGGRRGQGVAVLGLCADDWERTRFEHLLACAAQGRLFDEEIAFRPSVLVQQALGLTMQNPKHFVTPKALHQRLPPSVASQWSQGDCEDLFAAAAQADLLRPVDRGRWVLEVKAQKLLERGTAHSTLRDSAEVEVLDAVTMRAVGRARVSAQQREALAGGDHEVTFSLGGRRRRARSMRGDKLVVEGARGADEGVFIAREAPRYSAELAGDLAGYIGLAPPRMRLYELPPRADGSPSWRLEHFLGTVWGEVLAGALGAAGYARAGAAGGPFWMDLGHPVPGAGGDPADGPLGLGRGEVLRDGLRAAVEARARRLARRLGAGRFHEVVPDELALRWLLRSVDVERLAKRLERAVVVEGAPREDDEGEEDDGCCENGAP